jgi:hypothetical protein
MAPPRPLGQQHVSLRAILPAFTSWTGYLIAVLSAMVFLLGGLLIWSSMQHGSPAAFIRSSSAYGWQPSSSALAGGSMSWGDVVSLVDASMGQGSRKTQIQHLLRDWVKVQLDVGRKKGLGAKAGKGRGILIPGGGKNMLAAALITVRQVCGLFSWYTQRSGGTPHLRMPFTCVHTHILRTYHSCYISGCIYCFCQACTP